MFIVRGPHMPAGNQPTTLEVAVKWIGMTIRHMEESKLTPVKVTKKAADCVVQSHRREYGVLLLYQRQPWRIALGLSTSVYLGKVLKSCLNLAASSRIGNFGF